MKIRTAIIISTVSALIIPNFLYAATLGLGSLVELANTLASGVVTSLGYLFFALAVVAFLWGMVQFIWNARNGDSGKGMENGKQFMLWGLIALFVMFSVWGIIKFTQGVFNINGQTSIIIPNIQLLGSSPATNTGTPSAPQGLPQGDVTCYDATTGKNGTTDASGNCVVAKTSAPATTAVPAQANCYEASTGKTGTYSSKYGGCVPSGLCLKTDTAGKTTFATGAAGVDGVCK